MDVKAKPLGRKSYGSIGHLPDSRLGEGDHKLNEGQTRILTEKARDKYDCIIVQEKLDGSNVSVARKNGQIIALGRAGYLAQTSKYEQHQLFADWVRNNETRFTFLEEGEWLSGEWLAQAHGTRYELSYRKPFSPFDLFAPDGTRFLFDAFCDRLYQAKNTLVMPHCLSVGPPMSTKLAFELLGDSGFHGAMEYAEGVVYRVERKGKVDFLGKCVRKDKIDGYYLPEISGKEAVWNWRP